MEKDKKGERKMGGRKEENEEIGKGEEGKGARSGCGEREKGEMKDEE